MLLTKTTMKIRSQNRSLATSVSACFTTAYTRELWLQINKLYFYPLHLLLFTFPFLRFFWFCCVNLHIKFTATVTRVNKRSQTASFSTFRQATNPLSCSIFIWIYFSHYVHPCPQPTCLKSHGRFTEPPEGAGLLQINTPA